MAGIRIKRLATVLSILTATAVLWPTPAWGHWKPGLHNTKHAIVGAWCPTNRLDRICPRGYEALRVADCETGGTFSVWANNGQYLGLFQMGSSERRKFGHGNDPWTQAEAAHRYYEVSFWYPWECAYLIGIL